MGYIGKITDTAGSTHLVGSTLYGTCSTASGTAAKVVTCSNFGELVTGVTIHVKFDNANLNTELGATLNVNNTGAKTIVGGIGGSTVPGQGFRWAAGCVVSFTYDGTYWVMNDSYLNTSTDTKVMQTATTTNSNYPILFKNSANQTDETDQVRYGNTTNKVPTVNPSTGTLNVWCLTAGSGGVVSPTLNDVSISHSSGSDAIIFTAGDTILEMPGHSDYALGPACEKGVDTSIASGSTSTNVPTTEAVRAYVDSVAGAAAAGALVYQGTLGATTGSTAALPASHNQGWYYVVADAGTYTGKVCEPGDMIICNHTRTTADNSDWDVVQSNIETLTNPEIDTEWTNAVAVS